MKIAILKVLILVMQLRNGRNLITKLLSKPLNMMRNMNNSGIAILRQENRLKAERFSLEILVYWALLYNRTKLACVLWSFSHDPIPLAQIMIRIINSLIEETNDWSYYNDQLLAAREKLIEISYSMLDKAFQKDSYRASDCLYGNLVEFL